MGVHVSRRVHSDVGAGRFRYLGDVFKHLARQKESRIEEGHLLADHVHMLISIPPKHADRLAALKSSQIQYPRLCPGIRYSVCDDLVPLTLSGFVREELLPFRFTRRPDRNRWEAA